MNGLIRSPVQLHHKQLQGHLETGRVGQGYLGDCTCVFPEAHEHFLRFWEPCSPSLMGTQRAVTAAKPMWLPALLKSRKRISVNCRTPNLHVPHHLLKLPKFMSIASVMPSSHLILWSPLLLLPSTFASIRDLSNESAVCIRWPKYWSFSFSISPSNEYSGLISLKIDWFDLLDVQKSLRSLLQHHSLKASILWCSAFLMVQLSQLYVTPGKTTTLTIWTFVSRVMSLLFNTLSRFVIAFLPRSNHLLISQLQAPSTVFLESKERKSVTTSSFAPSICHEVMGRDATILVVLIVSSKLALSLSSFTLIEGLFSSSSFCH